MRFTKDHEWVIVQGDVATVGITAYAAEQLGDVVFVETPDAGKVVKQGEQLIAVGDIAAARTVLQRASDAGDAAASVALAATYDPMALQRLGALGVHADLQKARDLYEKAKHLGSAEASRRLQVLARR